jgi:hypothetical protein
MGSSTSSLVHGVSSQGWWAPCSTCGRGSCGGGARSPRIRTWPGVARARQKWRRRSRPPRGWSRARRCGPAKSHRERNFSLVCQGLPDGVCSNLRRLRWSAGADRGPGSSPGGLQVGELLLDGVIPHAGDLLLAEVAHQQGMPEALAVRGGQFAQDDLLAALAWYVREFPPRM